MRFFNFFLKVTKSTQLLFSKINKNAENNLKHESKTHSNIQNSEDIPLSEKYPNIDDEELYSILEDKELNGEKLTSVELNFLEENSFSQLFRTIHSEHLYGRSLAIQGLINNEYQILKDEYGNPFKESINFTLLYFEKYFNESAIDAEQSLRDSFPTMYHYIKRQIDKQHNEIIKVSNFDDQNAYEEFLVFCKKTFCSLYPEKNIRDEKIKNNFKIFHPSLIKFIEGH